MCCLNEPEDYDSENCILAREGSTGCKHSLLLRLRRNTDLRLDSALQTNTVFHPGSEGATFFAMGGASLLKGGYQAVISFLSRSGSCFAQEMGTLAGKAAQTLQTISANSIGNYPATSSVSAYLLKNKLIAQEISGGHAFIKHVIKQKEFSGFSRFQFQGHIQSILNNPIEMKLLTRGRTAYWDQKTGTVIVRDPLRIDGGTAFRPINGKSYYEDVLK